VSAGVAPTVEGVWVSGVGGPNMRIQPTPPLAARLMRLPLGADGMNFEKR